MLPGIAAPRVTARLFGQLVHTHLYIFTFREGLLARLAHDLRLHASAFEFQLEAGRLRGWVDPSSLEVDGVAHGQRVDGSALSADDKRKIQHNLRQEVLEIARYPRIEIEGSLARGASGWQADVLLQLHGTSRRLQIPVKLEADRAIAEIEIRPSDFGIAPYKALGGAIRLQDRVRVSAIVLAERDKLEAASASGRASMFRPG